MSLLGLRTSRLDLPSSMKCCADRLDDLPWRYLPPGKQHRALRLRHVDRQLSTLLRKLLRWGMAYPRVKSFSRSCLALARPVLVCCEDPDTRRAANARLRAARHLTNIHLTREVTLRRAARQPATHRKNHNGFITQRSTPPSCTSSYPVRQSTGHCGVVIAVACEGIHRGPLALAHLLHGESDTVSLYVPAGHARQWPDRVR
mmetsp:Transcript_41451/g.117700  ORF Transcript_41451/g.117700 Transcript_41451/m.117700 type:complete len:202 (-) Transcript_41451:1716-2321(-)